MKSWQVFYEARRSIKNELCSVFGNRSSRMVDYWAQDPACCADPKRNPIDRLVALLMKLSDAGHRDAAVAAVRILAGAINLRVVEREEVIPDKDTIMEEIVDDFPCLLAYQRALQGTDLEEVDRAKACLDRELAEDRVKFIEVNGLEDPVRVSSPPRRP